MLLMKACAKQNNLFLIGPMGSGKSSVAKHIAKLTGLSLYDSDQAIEQLTGVDISWIFEAEGEAGFRRREIDMIHELTSLKNIVLSTGGGTVIESINRERLSKQGTVIYLRVSLEEQLKRATSRISIRPLLAKSDPRETLEKLNHLRTPFYEEIADVIIETDHEPAFSIAQSILSELELEK